MNRGLAQPGNPHVLSGHSKKESLLAGADSHIQIISPHLPVNINTHIPRAKPIRRHYEHGLCFGKK